MLQHRLAVMSDQYSALTGCNFKDLWIRNPLEFTVGGKSEVDRRLPSPDCNNDSVMEVGVGLIPDQGRASPILMRARSSFSQSAGLASDSGMVLASNSRALSFRNSSMSAL